MPDNVLEHLGDTTQTMEEIYRITNPGAKVFLAIPFWNSFEAWGDPTHERLFSEEIFEFYDPTTWRGEDRAYYSKAKFKIGKNRILRESIRASLSKPPALPFRPQNRTFSCQDTSSLLDQALNALGVRQCQLAVE